MYLHLFKESVVHVHKCLYLTYPFFQRNNDSERVQVFHNSKANKTKVFMKDKLWVENVCPPGLHPRIGMVDFVVCSGNAIVIINAHPAI